MRKEPTHFFLFPTEHVENHNWPIATAKTSTTLRAIESDLASFKTHEHFHKNIQTITLKQWVFRSLYLGRFSHFYYGIIVGSNQTGHQIYDLD